jgi:hypothetical protein
MNALTHRAPRSHRSSPHRSVFLVVLAALALAAAACGGDDDTSVGGPGTAVTTAPGGDEPVTSPPGAGTVPGAGPTRVEPDPDAQDPRPVTFDPTMAQATDGGVLVRFYSGIAPCYVLQRVEVAETDETVAVGLFVGNLSGGEDIACIQIAMLYEVEIDLAAPLGDRTLVDANA